MSPPPVLLVVVDTEEEFDWGSPFDRGATSVRAMADIHLGQEICEQFGIRPVYVVDYPVVSQEEGWLPLREIIAEDRAVVGAHLHPWVSPPLGEEMTIANTFPGNLPADLEKKKLAVLTHQIQEVFGKRPNIYKAGRYGFGPNTSAILEELGYEIDLSPAPPFDFCGGGGPDFSFTPNFPHPIGSRRKILCLPTTGDYIGGWSASRVWAHRIYRLAASRQLGFMHLPGIFARTRLLERVRLSPEGYNLGELERLTMSLLGRGLRVFSLTFHSPTLRPGCTPYVKDKHDLDRFVETLRGYFQFFFHVLGGITLTPAELKTRIDAERVRDSEGE